MLRALMESSQARRVDKPPRQIRWGRVREVAFSVGAVASITLGVFLMAGVWGFVALGIGLLALDFVLDEG